MIVGTWLLIVQGIIVILALIDLAPVLISIPTINQNTLIQIHQAHAPVGPMEFVPSVPHLLIYFLTAQPILNAAFVVF